MNLLQSFLINLILFILLVEQAQCKLNNATETIDILKLEKLSFYKDCYTVGKNERPQIQCKNNNDECDDLPEKIVCTNNDFGLIEKINATKFNFTCDLSYQSKSFNIYYPDETSIDVQCEDLNRTDTERFVIAGSCSISLFLIRTPIYKNWLFLFISVLTLSLVIGVFYYLRGKRVGYHPI